MAIAAAATVSNPVRLSGNVLVSFVKFTFSGNYAAGGESPTNALQDGIPGFVSTKPIAILGVSDTGYSLSYDPVNDLLSQWNGTTEMPVAGYASATAYAVVYSEKF